jgi:hypothetical protein
LNYSFNADLEIIGANPFVRIPVEILDKLFKEAKKDKGYIPIKGTVNDIPYTQTLVKYKGEWRLYINMAMLKNSPNRIGENIALTVELDMSDRHIEPHPKLLVALNANSEAKAVFDGLSPSKRHEIVRYISFSKTDATVERNVKKAIEFLLGNGRFVGRDKP